MEQPVLQQSHTTQPKLNEHHSHLKAALGKPESSNSAEVNACCTRYCTSCLAPFVTKLQHDQPYVNPLQLISLHAMPENFLQLSVSPLVLCF